MNIPYINDKLFWEIFTAVIILLVGWLVIKILIHIEKKMLEKSTLDSSVYILIMRVTRIVLWILLIMTILNQFDQVSMAPFVAVIGTIGAAIALALKDSLGNVAGGIILLFTKPFVQGDEIQLNGVTGVIDHIDLLTTTMHTYDNREIIVPNGTITTSMVINSSRRDLRRVDCKFCVGYETDIDRAKEVLKDIVREGPLLLEDPEPWIGVSDHGESSLQIDFKVWCATADRYTVKAYIEEMVKRRFEEEGINIPYPQMDVHLVTTAKEN
jgi:small conductance mechanosensitive channel